MTNNIGKFLQEVRKEKGLTQKDLAEKIGVSDKTISKWENGNSTPDTSMLLSISEALDVTVNEILSGERIPPENYSMKAEETIMSLMKENEKSKKANFISRIIGIVLLAIAIILIMVSTQRGFEGLQIIAYFIDAPSLVFVAIASTGVVLVSGARQKRRIFSLLSRIIIPVGVVVTIMSAVIMTSMLSDISKLGPNLCVVSLPLLYSYIAKIVIEALNNKYDV